MSRDCFLLSSYLIGMLACLLHSYNQRKGCDFVNHWFDSTPTVEHSSDHFGLEN